LLSVSCFSKRSKTFKCTKDTQSSGTSSPGGPRKGEEEHTHRHTLKAYVEQDRTGSRFTYAEKEGVEGGKERRNGGRAIGGRWKKGRSRVGGKGGGMKREIGTGRAWAGKEVGGEGSCVCACFVPFWG